MCFLKYFPKKLKIAECLDLVSGFDNIIALLRFFWGSLQNTSFGFSFVTLLMAKAYHFYLKLFSSKSDFKAISARYLNQICKSIGYLPVLQAVDFNLMQIHFINMNTLQKIDFVKG